MKKDGIWVKKYGSSPWLELLDDLEIPFGLEPEPISIYDLVKARDDLKEEISEVIRNSLKKFKNKTGLSPYAIDISMIEVTTISERRKDYVLGNITIHVEI